METPGSQSSLHRANLERVVRAVRLAGSLTQAEIARTTGLSAATVSNIVRELKDGGTVEVTPTSAGGRRARSVSLSGDAGIVIGVDFGHLPPGRGQQPRPPGAGRGGRAAGRGRLRRPGLRPGRTAGQPAGRGDRRGPDQGGRRGARRAGPRSTSSRARWAPPRSCRAGGGTKPAEELRERLGVPVHVDNDANLGALGELVWGSGKGVRDLAYIKVASGVGAGLVIDGKIYRGPGGTAGEIGHITLDESGPVCRCGNRGCLETFAAARYVLPLLQPSHGTDLTMEGVVRLARDGDPGCRRVIADVGRHIGSGVANLCNLLNPSRVVLGGDLAEAGELVLGPIRESVGRYAIPARRGELSVLPGALGGRAGGARSARPRPPARWAIPPFWRVHCPWRPLPSLRERMAPLPSR